MYIVIYDDNDGLVVPMTWDADCDGAICSRSPNEAVALFETRSTARKAIEISTRFAQLCRAQNKPANADFLDSFKKNIHIVPLAPSKKEKS